MKVASILIVFLFFSSTGFSQKTKIRELEPLLSQQEGLPFAKSALTLAELYYHEAMYKMAVRRADDAHKTAKEIGDKDLMAKALQWRGLAYEKSANGKKMLLNKAYKSFEESNKHTTDQRLRLKNFQHLKSLAERLDRPKDAERADNHLAILLGEKNKNDGAKLFNRKIKKAYDEYEQLKTEKQQIAEQKDDLAEALSELVVEESAIREEQALLIRVLEQKEAAIATMNQEQMKKELLLSEQERQLDLAHLCQHTRLLGNIAKRNADATTGIGTPGAAFRTETTKNPPQPVAGFGGAGCHFGRGTAAPVLRHARTQCRAGGKEPNHPARAGALGRIVAQHPAQARGRATEVRRHGAGAVP